MASISNNEHNKYVIHKVEYTYISSKTIRNIIQVNTNETKDKACV